MIDTNLINTAYTIKLKPKTQESEIGLFKISILIDFKTILKQSLKCHFVTKLVRVVKLNKSSFFRFLIFQTHATRCSFNLLNHTAFVVFTLISIRMLCAAKTLRNAYSKNSSRIDFLRRFFSIFCNLGSKP